MGHGPSARDRGWRVTSGEPDPATVERLLRKLPTWFGIESSVLGYIESARRLPAYLAWPRGPASAGHPPHPAAGHPPHPAAGHLPDPPAGHLPDLAVGHLPDLAPNRPPDLPAGVLLTVRHFPRAAEIYLLAVDPAVHRRGAGRALVTALESDLGADDVEFLQVKTLGPSHPDPGYVRTRQFYASVGFQPLEEITGLWPENPCLIMIKTLQPRGDVANPPGGDVQYPSGGDVRQPSGR
jgi:ribosomal protein S18 acetylase RimI-like enzyme